MIYVPRPPQALATPFMLDTPRCNLWADMGTGKTGATLDALDTLMLAGSGFMPALILGPKRVARGVWSAECAKWDHLQALRVSPIIGTPKQRAAALRAKADIYTINYENIPWLVDRLRDEWPFGIVVADESTKLKGFRLRKGGLRAAALSKIAKRTGRWVNLTGTPSPKGLVDLWGQNWFVDGGERLGRTYTAFKDRWFDENEYARTLTPKPGAADEIPDLLSDVTLSINASDFFDLHKPIETPVFVDLPPKVRTLYDEMEKHLLVELDGLEVEAVSAAAKSMKCLQIASGVLYTNARDEKSDWKPLHDEKLDALSSIATEHAGRPLLVAYQFKSDLARLRKAFPKARELHTAKDEADWNAGKIPMLLVHPASAGHGLNLQDGGHVLVFFTPWWSVENDMQVIERIGPMRQYQSGYDRPVYIYRLVARDTVDESVTLRRTENMSIQQALRARAGGLLTVG